MKHFLSIQAKINTPVSNTSTGYRRTQPAQRQSKRVKSIPESPTQLERAPRLAHSLGRMPVFPEAAAVESNTQEDQLGQQIRAARKRGHPLSTPIRHILEAKLGMDMSHVHLHTDPEADHLSRAINAIAFTSGTDIFFRSGAYHPDSPQGLHTLAHEATHVVQQAAGQVSGIPLGDGIRMSEPDDRFEQVAEMSASQIMSDSALQQNLLGRLNMLLPSLHPTILPAHDSPIHIQRLPTGGEFNWRIRKQGGNEENLFLRQISNTLSAYHRESEGRPGRWAWKSTHQAYADRQLKNLDDLEHKAYKWLDVNKASTSEGANVERKAIFDLLDEIQQAHIEHIDYIHKNDLKLSTPDRGQLPSAEQDKLDRAWDQLRHGTGSIKIQQGDQYDKANKELRAMHARLLSRPTGRNLLYELFDDDPTKQIQIKHVLEDGPTVEKLQQQREQKRQLAELESRQQDFQQKYLKLEALWEEASLEGKQTIENDMDKISDEIRNLTNEADAIKKTNQTGGKISLTQPASAEPSTAGATYINGKPGPGTGAFVSVRQGIRDSELMNKGEKGNYIPAPAFVVYGHELIHALHYKHGTKDMRHQNYTENDYKNEDLKIWTSPEEHQTMADLGNNPINENALRKEHGITQRWGHTAKARVELEDELRLMRV